MKKTNTADADLKSISENDFAYIINNQQITNVFHIYLNEEVAEQKHYRDIFNCLRTANEEDYFVIYINNFGGYVHTAIDIINSIRNCRGKILMRITGPIYSAAPLIALQGHKILIEDNAFMMFHDYSGATHGKGHEQEASIRNDKPFFDEMFAQCTKGFLTRKEIKQVCKGQDLYVKRDDVIKRLKRMGKFVTNE